MSNLIKRLNEELPDPQQNREDAAKYVDILGSEGKLYHFDDDPADIVNAQTDEQLFSEEELLVVKEYTYKLYSDDLFLAAINYIEKE